MSEKKELTLLQKQQVETMKKILEYKLPAEANVVSIIFKSPSVLIETFVELKEDDFHNKCWKAFFQIAYILIWVIQHIIRDKFLYVGIVFNAHRIIVCDGEEDFIIEFLIENRLDYISVIYLFIIDIIFMITINSVFHLVIQVKNNSFPYCIF